MTLRMEVQGTHGRARAGVLHTRRHVVPTPTFMPVATHASFSHMSLPEAAAAGAQILLSNTFHLMLRPGQDVFHTVGGIHAFMNWDRGVLTDSGGFQIFSLPGERHITEEAAHFRSFHDNSRHTLSPESSIRMQRSMGSDIMMVLDVCVPSTLDLPGTRDAMDRTHRWALRSLREHQREPGTQALFGIVQGGIHLPLRGESAAVLTQHPFDGFAIGGLAVGEGKEAREEVTAWVTARLPEDRPRYLMGVGTPVDVLEAVVRGVDMMDCILPTKMAQQGYAYTFDGLLRLTRPRYRDDTGPLDGSCGCHVCRTYSRAYVQHLVGGRHPLGARYLSIHNVAHYMDLVSRLRAAIVAGTLDTLTADLRERLTRKDRGA